ncbi:MAG: serine/threonine-protein kinase [Myxococcota bacterium]
MNLGDETLPHTLGRYEIRGVLGYGGMGRVLAGHDPLLRRDVAIKLLEAHDLDPHAFEQIRFMFHREARALAALAHPNIVEIYDYSGPDAQQLFIACELITGPTLREVLDERCALSLRTSVALGYELAIALERAHHSGIVHRDIKPENVFWLREGRVVLSDFGIAKALEGHSLGATLSCNQTQIYGSPCYIAPERLAGQEATPQSDLFALGVVLYECLAGFAPFDGSNDAAILEAVAAGQHVSLATRVDVPDELACVVEGLLCADPQGRPPDAGHVQEVLRRILDALDVADPRRVLADFGVVAPQAPEDIEDETAIYVPAASESIRVEHPKNTWGTLAVRAPALIAMLAVAVALSAGVYVFRRMSSLESPGQAFAHSRTVEVTTELAQSNAVSAESAAASQDRDDVFVLLHLRGETTVMVNGKPVGTWDRRVRLALPPGRHEIVGRSALGDVTRDVRLMRNTEPEFDLYVEQP